LGTSKAWVIELAGFRYLEEIRIKEPSGFMQEPAKYFQVFNLNLKIFCWVGVKCRYHKNSICWGQVFQILASASYICLYTMSDPPVVVWSKIKELPNTGGEWRLPVVWGRLVMGFALHPTFCPLFDACRHLSAFQKGEKKALKNS
jgi:hypothetical protein